MGARVHKIAVENRGDAVAVADDFETVPLAVRALDIARAAVAEGIRPVGIATPPVDAPAALHDCFAAGLKEDRLVFAACLDGEAGGILSAHDDEVAHAALDDLHLDRLEPVPVRRIVRADAVHEDPGVRVLQWWLAGSPSLST
jgi:hypothetical protein